MKNRVFDLEIVYFAGFYKIINAITGDRVGGLYPSYNDAYNACIEHNRLRLGIML